MANVDQDMVKQAASAQAIAQTQPDGQMQQVNAEVTSIGDYQFNLSSDKMLKLLKASPSVDFNLNFTTTKGGVKFMLTSTIGNKSLTQLDPQSVMSTASFKSSVELDKNMAYLILAQYLQDEIHNKEKEFFENNKVAAKNPYTFSDADLQTVVEDFVNNLLDKLLAEKLITENGDKFSTNVEFDKNVLMINGIKIDNDYLTKINTYITFTPNGVASAPAVAPTSAPTNATPPEQIAMPPEPAAAPEIAVPPNN